MSDIHAIRRGLISITPLQTDTTHHATVAAFRVWEAVLKNGHIPR
jgi:broad specificity polyphosphatase/5'/3'-nucleotidase SurE